MFSVLEAVAWDRSVALVGIEGELAEELAGGGVDDADVAVLGQDQDAGSGVGSADADGVEPALVAQGDLPAGVDAVAAESVVGVGTAVAGGGLGAAGVDRGRGGSVRQGAVRTVVVVGLDEGVDQRLQLADRGRLDRLGAQPLLQGLLEAFDFAAGGGVVGSGVLLGDVPVVELLLESVAASAAADAGQGRIGLFEQTRVISVASAGPPTDAYTAPASDTAPVAATAT